MVPCPYPKCKTITKSHRPGSSILQMHRDLAQGKGSDHSSSGAYSHSAIMGEMSHDQGSENNDIENFFDDFEEDKSASMHDVLSEFGQDGAQELISHGYYVRTFMDAEDRSFVNTYADLAKNGDSNHLAILSQHHHPDVRMEVARHGYNPMMMYQDSAPQVRRCVGEYLVSSHPTRSSMTEQQRGAVDTLAHDSDKFVRGSVVPLMSTGDLFSMAMDKPDDPFSIAHGINDATRSRAHAEIQRRRQSELDEHNRKMDEYYRQHPDSPWSPQSMQSRQEAAQSAQEQPREKRSFFLRLFGYR